MVAAGFRVQLPFSAGDDSLPEPDLAIVEPRRYMDAHPSQAFLIIEVADSSFQLDWQEPDVAVRVDDVFGE